MTGQFSHQSSKNCHQVVSVMVFSLVTYWESQINLRDSYTKLSSIEAIRDIHRQSQNDFGPAKSIRAQTWWLQKLSWIMDT